MPPVVSTARVMRGFVSSTNASKRPSSGLVAPEAAAGAAGEGIVTAGGALGDD